MLIVDDDEAWRGLYAAEFKRDFRLVEAADGLEALNALERAKPDIILLDLRLPRLNGLDFLRALERQGVRAQVVVCSGLVEDEASFPIPGVRTAPKSAGLREIRAAVEQALGPPSATPTSSRTRSDRR
jgi:DNA-binding response OmpR family regulator